MSEILQELGIVVVLVVGLAAIHRRAKATELSVEEMQEAFDTNLIAAFNLTKAYLATPLPKTKTILNISSASA